MTAAASSSSREPPVRTQAEAVRAAEVRAGEEWPERGGELAEEPGDRREPAVVGRGFGEDMDVVEQDREGVFSVAFEPALERLEGSEPQRHRLRHARAQDVHHQAGVSAGQVPRSTGRTETRAAPSTPRSGERRAPTDLQSDSARRRSR
jgi:hypothetical protein